MATYIKPDAVKDGSLSKSKLDTALVNEINGKLTDAPKDGKVYGRSDGEWIEDEDGAVYELIEDITLEEAVQEIIKRTEPDGTPYNFKRMCVYLNKPTTAIGNPFRQTFFLKNLPHASFPFCQIMANLSESHQAFTICKPENGHWTARMNCQNINGVAKNSYGMTDDIDTAGEYNRILGIQFVCSQSILFEAGTNIKIYGIR